MIKIKNFQIIIKKEQKNNLDDDNSLNEFLVIFENSNQILKTITNVTDKANKHIDILVAQYIIQKKEIIKFLNILTEMTKKNKLLNIRILLPSSKFNEEDIPSNINSYISIKYFDRHLSSNTITLILDSEFMYILGESENTNDDNRYFIQPVNSESRKLVYITLFERMWLLEKSVVFRYK